MSSKQKTIPTMTDVLASTQRAFSIGVTVLIALGVLLLISIFTNVNLASRIADVANKRPIYVVPGAVKGVYAPGLADYNVANAARYLLSLGSTLTVSNAKARLDELETYCSPEFLPKFRVEKARLLKEIQMQQQSRAVQSDGGDTLSIDKKKMYTFTLTGAWEIRSGSLLMSQVTHRFTILFSVGNADEGNPYGIQLYGFDATPIDGKDRRSGSNETSAL